MAPKTEPKVQIKANRNDFARLPNARAMSKISGGTGKKTDSENASINNAQAP
jgi:hypothetical protein